MRGTLLGDEELRSRVRDSSYQQHLTTLLYNRVCRRCGRPVLYASTRKQGRDRLKVVALCSADFSEFARSLRRCEGEPLEERDVVTGSKGQPILHDLLHDRQPARLSLGRHLGHPEHQGDPLALRDEAHHDQIIMPREEGVAAHDGFDDT